jgi:hypothetical protein
MPRYKSIVRTGEHWLIYCEADKAWRAATVTHVGGRIATLTLESGQPPDREFYLIPLDTLLSDPERFRFVGAGGGRKP